MCERMLICVSLCICKTLDRNKMKDRMDRPTDVNMEPVGQVVYVRENISVHIVHSI